MMLTDKHYYAFISHSTRDAKVALWLRDRLVSYNIPASVQREHRAPKRLRPIFIYQTDLAGSNLQDALQRELDDSQWLIVICSPEGAKSPYVNGEIEHFIETGRADRIIPFIVAGTPHAKNLEKECFPPALLRLAQEGTELRGINLDESVRQLGSKMGAVVNVVATMLGVRFGSMWNVYKRKQRRRMMVATACALVLCLAGLFAWDYTRPTYRCFADYVDRWGVPEGIIELNKEQQSHRNCMYLFEYRRIPFGEPNAYSWRVVKVSYVNSARRPMEYRDMIYVNDDVHYPITYIQYDKEDGVVSQLILADENERPKLRYAFSAREGVTATVVDILSAKQSQGVGFSASISELNSSIVRYVYERDTNGYIIRQTFHANNDYNIHRSLTSHALGYFGNIYERDSLGRIVKMRYLDYWGNVTFIYRGLAGYDCRYDTDGNLMEYAFFNIDELPTVQYGESHKVIYSYDKYGNVTECTYYGTDGQPCVTYSGCAKEIYQYDDYGKVTECSYYGLDGQPCVISYGYTKEIYQYDDYGNQIECTYYGINGELCLDQWGYAKEVNKYDDQNNWIESAYYDTLGQPCICRWGYAKKTLQYDTRGNITEIVFYGTDGQPMMLKRGYAKEINKYDDRGNMIESAYYDTIGHPCLLKEGYAKHTFKYDDRGNQIERSFYDTEGKLCLTDGGYSKSTSQYDERGNEIETAFFGLDGQPCMSKYGYAKEIAKYDDHCRLIEFEYFDVDGKPCLSSSGIARLTCLYNEQGHEKEVIHYNEQNVKIKRFRYHNNDEIAEITTYDDLGRIVKVVHYDTEGNVID